MSDSILEQYNQRVARLESIPFSVTSIQLDDKTEAFYDHNFRAWFIVRNEFVINRYGNLEGIFLSPNFTPFYLDRTSYNTIFEAIYQWELIKEKLNVRWKY